MTEDVPAFSGKRVLYGRVVYGILAFMRLPEKSGYDSLRKNPR